MWVLYYYGFYPKDPSEDIDVYYMNSTKRFSKYLGGEKNIKILLIVFIGLSIFLRFYKISTIPPDTEGDASIHGIHALKISDNIDLDSIIPEVASYFWLYIPWHILLGILFKIFGISIYIMIITSLIISIITIFCIYLTGKNLFGERAGLFSSFFALNSLWYFTFSRYALGFITIMPLFYILTLYNLFLYDENKKNRYLIFAGLLLGAGWLNGYPHIISILPIFFIYKTWREHSLWWVFNWRYLLFIILGVFTYITGVIIIAKLLKASSIWIIPKSFDLYFIDYKVKERGVLSITGLFSKMRDNLCFILRDFFISDRMDDNPCFACFTVLGYPLISPIVSIFLFIGVIRALIHRKPVDKLLLVWMFLPYILYLLTVKNICSRYFLGIFPALYLLVGRGIHYFFGLIFKRLAKIIVVTLVIFLAICSLYEVYKGYFVNYAGNDCNLHRHYGMREISEYVDSQISNNLESIVVFGDKVLVPSFSFHLYTKGKYIPRSYYWDEFIDCYGKESDVLKNKTIVFMFSGPDDPKVKIFGRDSKITDFKKYFGNIEPNRVIKYNDGTIAKLVYILKL